MTKRPYFSTHKGHLYLGKCEDLLKQGLLSKYKNKIDLIFTSPPFPLNRKKKYGNKTGSDFTAWLSDFSPLFSKLLSPKGSIVMEMGNAWVPGKPIQSTLALEALLGFLNHKDAKLRLCQEFVCYNPARLPGPAEWVTVRRIRVKDAFTKIWWMAKTDFPKAHNRSILQPYSDAMIDLLRRKSYNAGARPSEHVIDAKSFLSDNGGAIPPNVLTCSNTASVDVYLNYCRNKGIKPHPARMPIEVPEFFIKFLTGPNDLVFDPFAGSNTTGYAAERLGRRWLSFEAQRDYAKTSTVRFRQKSAKDLASPSHRSSVRRMITSIS